MKFISAVISDVGKVRENNEDNYYLGGKYRKDVRKDKIFLRKNIYGTLLCGVFDGMGGQSGGETASLVAAEMMVQYDNTDFSKNHSEYFFSASETVRKQKKEMGTTAAVVYIESEMLYSYNLGDSRSYIIRNGEIKQLSKDHTRAAMMVEMGILKEEEGKFHRDRNVLVKYMGMDCFEKEYVCNTEVIDGDMILICSDGLYDMLSEEEIKECLDKNVRKSVKRLLTAALKAGGRDNITAMLVRVKK